MSEERPPLDLKDTPSETMHTRTAWLLGEDAPAILARSGVTVFGLGGVGSVVTEVLARTGVGTLLLIDYVTVRPSNVNRQLPATSLTIGEKKTALMQRRVSEINPACRAEVLDCRYGPENGDAIFAHIRERRAGDGIADAIDTLPAKADLISRAGREGIPIISSMGAGNRLDPTAFRVGDVFQVTGDPLARRLRKLLRENGTGSLRAVYSTELPVRKGPPGSVMFVTAAAGLVLAGEMIRLLLERGRNHG